MLFTPPSPNCPLCPRLADFREVNRGQFPHFFNAPVPSFGAIDAPMLIIGLAPGLQGANQTGRPFTGDYAGFILYRSLLTHGFAKGDYLATLPRTLDGRLAEGGAGNFPKQSGEFGLVDCRISNAVRCLPPENKPEPSEIKNCNSFLKAEIAAMPNLKVIVSLGLVSHNAVLKALGYKAAHGKFGHGAEHKLVPPPIGGRLGGGHSGFIPQVSPHPNPPPNGEGVITLLDSYHCSRYNINTGRLNQQMFDDVVMKARALI